MEQQKIARNINRGLHARRQVASVDHDRIIVVTTCAKTTCAKWERDTVAHTERSDVITGTRVVSAVQADLAGDREESAWSKIEKHLQKAWQAKK
jgi:hypothetical protein